MSSFSVFGRSVGARRGLALGLLSLTILLGGCGALPEDQPGPQFPEGARAEPIGTSGAPEREQAAALDVTGVPYDGVYPEDPAGPAGVAVANPPGGDGYADTDPSALTDFHAALDPYGQWADDPTYGTIWQPSAGVVGDDFAPYETAGHWSYGDDYVWVSDYSWGWAPFHYGRWVYATNGWGWIPGRQYAGAWTTWRTGYGPYNGYVGWAPLPPTYYWRGGVALGIGAVPPAAYGFCQSGNLFASNLSGRMLGGPEVGAMGQYSRPFQSSVPVSGHGGGMYGGGRTLAHPEVAGPSPQSLHIASNQVTRPPSNNMGLVRAAQFARPSTATALGGHAPAGWTGNHAISAGVGQARPYGTSMGMSAYGSAYRGTESRSLGAIGGESSFARSHSAFRPSTTLHGGSYYGGGSHFAGHAGGGAAPVPQYHPPAYGGGYHPSGGGGWGGHSSGGHGGGGGGHGGGHR
jgi:hypothetical protein